MAKSKSITNETEQVQAEEVKSIFIPIRKKYKPIPKFNGKCKDC